MGAALGLRVTFLDGTGTALGSRPSLRGSLRGGLGGGNCGGLLSMGDTSGLSRWPVGAKTGESGGDISVYWLSRNSD